ATSSSIFLSTSQPVAYCGSILMLGFCFWKSPQIRSIAFCSPTEVRQTMVRLTGWPPDAAGWAAGWVAAVAVAGWGAGWVAGVAVAAWVALGAVVGAAAGAEVGAGAVVGLGAAAGAQAASRAPVAPSAASLRKARRFESLRSCILSPSAFLDHSHPN